MQKLCAEKISPDSLEKAQNRVIDAALTLVRENTRLKACHISAFIFALLNFYIYFFNINYHKSQ